MTTLAHPRIPAQKWLDLQTGDHYIFADRIVAECKHFFNKASVSLMPSRIPLQVLSGHCPIDELPDELDLSELADDMERLWMKNVERLDEGLVMEHAATIVMRPDGSLKLVNEVAGLPNFVVPNFIVVGIPNMLTREVLK